MDPTRFGALSRSLGRSRSWRTALTLLAAGPLALRGMPETAARHKKKHPCSRNTPAKANRTTRHAREPGAA
jgi:hypothetical protein